MHGTHAVVRVRVRGDEAGARWTVSASRRVGSAVQRNRAKRRLREAMRQVELPVGVDVVVIARRSARDCKFAELVGDLRAMIAQGAADESIEVRR